MKTLLLFVLMSGSCFAKDAIYKRIRNLRPNMSKTYTKKLASAIKQWSYVTGIEPKLMIAVFMQESRFKLNAKSCHRVGCDYGLSQIWEVTARSYGFDTDLLQTDLHYSVGAGFIVMYDIKKRWQKKEAYWWTRYNASNKKKRLKYRKLVQRFL